LFDFSTGDDAAEATPEARSISTLEAENLKDGRHRLSNKLNVFFRGIAGDGYLSVADNESGGDFKEAKTENKSGATASDKKLNDNTDKKLNDNHTSTTSRTVPLLTILWTRFFMLLVSPVMFMIGLFILIQGFALIFVVFKMAMKIMVIADIAKKIVVRLNAVFNVRFALTTEPSGEQAQGWLDHPNLKLNPAEKLLVQLEAGVVENVKSNVDNVNNERTRTVSNLSSPQTPRPTAEDQTKLAVSPISPAISPATSTPSQTSPIAISPASTTSDKSSFPKKPRSFWKIHGKKYDLTRFMDSHPGGSWPLILSKNSDCTYLFESYHIFPSRKRMEDQMAMYEIVVDAEGREETV